jgi:antitoxin CptB
MFGQGHAQPFCRMPRRADKIPMHLYMPAPVQSSDMSAEPESLAPRRRRLVFRARHRGTKEGDLMIGGFVTRHIATLTDAEIEALEAVLDFPDVDLADWLSGRRPVPEECRSPMLDRLVVECATPGAGIPEELRSLGNRP